MRFNFSFLIVSFLFTVFVYGQENIVKGENEISDSQIFSDTLDITVDEKVFSEGYIERQILKYEKYINEYKKELQSLLVRSIEEKKRITENKYDPAIKKGEEKEISHRKDAIILFEEFIKKYPDNPKYTPNAMYRLAELYYERSMVEFRKKETEYEKQLDLFEKNLTKKEPEAPLLNLSDTTKLYERIISLFPDFQYIGAVYYMLGYCYAESDNGDQAVRVWLELIDKKIETPYLAELYLRLGDHFFESNDLPKSEFYYKEGLKFTESDFFDKILYKYAWTQYRLSRFDEAIESFTKLLFYADDMKNKGINKGQDLRKEAIQYIAISFSDEDWGSVVKAINYFNSIKGDSFEKDVFEQIGKYYFENNNYDQAEKAYRFILNRHPYYENAPRIHDRIIQLFYKAREIDKAAKETSLFAKLYDADGEWARINRGNATAVREAVERAKTALLNTASYHHTQARTYKENGNNDAAVEQYRIAAIAYGEYLIKFPYTSDSYDITYGFAEALFYSGDIETAVIIYERIRDDKNLDKYREDAAYQAFFCYNTLWNKSPERDVKGDEKRGKPFSPLEEKLIESSDIFLATSKEDEDTPKVAYTVARIFWDHGKFEDAEKRYLKIINDFPESQAAVFAAKDIIAAYTEKKDWVSVAKWSKLLTERLSSKEKVNKSVKDEFATYRAGALFFHALKLEEEEKFSEAASEYLRIVEETPEYKDAPMALSNAAINFQRATMFESALQIHERVYQEYPDSKYAPQSLYLIAWNAEMSYDHEKAVNAYKMLYQKYPDYEKKSDAIYNAGFLLEKLQKYKEASNYYRLYYSEAKQKIEGKEALYMSGTMYKKAEDWNNMINSYENFINTFRNDTEVSHFVAKAYYEIAVVYEEKLNNWKKAKSYYEKILQFLDDKKVASEEALLYAAEAKFKILEDDFNDYLRMKISGKNEKQLGENLKKKVEKMKELDQKYREVLKFNIYEWAMATSYRIGYLYQSFSDSLFEADPPAGLSEEEEEIYIQMLRQQAEPIEEEAVKYYSSALEKAREVRSFNKWTQLITEKLSVMRPAEYKVGKTPMFSTDTSLNTGYPLLLSLDQIEKKEYQKAGMSGGAKKPESANQSKNEEEAPQ